MENQEARDYAVDVVFCIDVTGSMHSTIDQAKKWAIDFRGELAPTLEREGKVVSQLRARVVAFRDAAHDGSDWLETSPFYSLPKDDAEFASFVSGLSASGGGPQTESGLEGLAEAINSPWETGYDRLRHIIVLFTDAPAYELGASVTPATTSQGAAHPQDYGELLTQWGYEIEQGMSNDDAVMDYSAKRLLAFVPEAAPWTDVVEDFENSYYEFTAGTGCHDIHNIVIEMIVNSV
jgi:hypothetical protein